MEKDLTRFCAKRLLPVAVQMLIILELLAWHIRLLAFSFVIECPVRFFNWFSIYTAKIIPPVTLYEIVSEQGDRSGNCP